MSNQYLHTLTENATRLGNRIQETISEHTRDLAVSRLGGNNYLDGASNGGGVGVGGVNTDEKSKIAQIRKQLEGNSDREKLDAMKRLVALTSKNHPLTLLPFPSVVKLVASPSLEIRKLVYIYLLHHSPHEPDLTLLSINTFQRDLSDPNPLIRAMALRVLSGIRVQMIGSIVVMAIKKCASDMSPYVRKVAALAVPKCYDLDATHLPSLLPILTTLLADRSPLSIGASAHAFSIVCPERLDLLHPHFRRLCKILVEVDEWGQVEVMSLLMRYTRVMLTKPTEGGEAGEAEMDKDIKLLLDSVETVFQSRNPAVVVAATRVFYYIAPASYWPKFVHPLLRLLVTSREVERVVLAYLLIIAKTTHHLFAPFYTRFLLRSDDLPQVKKDKIKLLLNVLTVDNWRSILQELIHHSTDPNDQIVSASINGIGQIARRIPESTEQCLMALIVMIKSQYDVIVSSAVQVLKRLVQLQLPSSTLTPSPGSSTTGSAAPLSIIERLARRIDDIKHPEARACVVWLVGQYAGNSGKAKAGDPNLEGVAEWAPDVLRKGAKGFGQEAPLVKLQLITLAAKLYVLCPTHRTLTLLTRYVLGLARYDLDYDVRDRGRMLGGLLSGIGLSLTAKDDDEQTTPERAGVVLRREQVGLVLFEGKSAPIEDEEAIDGGMHPVLGSLNAINNSGGENDAVPEWMETGVEGQLRDTEEDAKPTVAFGSVPVVLTETSTSRPDSRVGVKKDLDDFYKEESEEEEEESEESSESSEEEQASLEG